MPGTREIPGQRDRRTVSAREIFLSRDNVLVVAGVIDSAVAYDGGNTSYEDELREGCLMGLITATKKWVPCKRTQANGAGTVATALIVDNAAFFKAGDTISIGGGPTMTISSVNYATNTITLAAADTWLDNEAVVAVASAGAETCRGVLDEFVKLKDEDGTLRDRLVGRIAISGGILKTGQILGDLTNIRAETVSKAILAGFRWDDEHGQA